MYQALDQLCGLEESAQVKRAVDMTLEKALIFLAVFAGVLWFAISPIDNANPARFNLARAAIGRNGPIGKVLEQYREDMGRYPDSTLGVEALFKVRSGEATDPYRGPYLEGTVEDLTDPWGNPFAYCAPGKFNKNGYDLYSFGPNGTDEDGREDSDDIKNWSTQAK